MEDFNGAFLFSGIVFFDTRSNFEGPSCVINGLLVAFDIFEKHFKFLMPGYVTKTYFNLSKILILTVNTKIAIRFCKYI